ncbi:hypothetical protein [Flavobacterium wongokense]|uniref:hypothetical protein n=1 Tax=Flavobacterium wongokense TaxID=2910674 RepID=UPI001F42D635|nr:hypothetical protein [Flavobacterium sp. WG47]MCF6131706.1 hypothetical protein [Flavobacterium sp. WG47]
MMYSLQNVTQTVECDVLLSRAQQRRADLNHKRYSEDKLTTKYTETSTEIEAALVGVAAEIAGEANTIASLPDGPLKDTHIFQKKQLEYKQLVLEHRLQSYGVVAVLEQEIDVSLLDRQIEEVDTFIVAVNARRVELASA